MFVSHARMSGVASAFFQSTILFTSKDVSLMKQEVDETGSATFLFYFYFLNTFNMIKQLKPQKNVH